MKEAKISTFDLNILRKDKLRELNQNWPKGDAFQQLCFDLLVRDLKDKGSTVRWSPYKTGGRDGAVDISGEDDQHNLFIVECKSCESLEAARKSLLKLASTLKNNLEKENARDSLYGEWFNPRLKKYYYCISCSLKNLDERNGFKAKVNKMLMELADPKKGLAHLEEVAENVELYSWDDLSAILLREPFLYQKWIGYHLPPGVEELVGPIEPGASLQYKDYLSGARLEYFSRDEYVRMNPDARGLVTETEILDTLLNRGLYHGYILYGEGGIGKTRLMLELGYLARKLEWIVYKVTSREPGLEVLRELIYPGHKHLLLFDYIEESAVLDTPNFFNDLVKISEGAEVKVIGNCRKSHFDSSQLRDADGFFTLNISIKDPGLEQDFKNRAVSHILGGLKRFFRGEKDFYELRPAFAVFLKYLNEKSGLKIELDFREVPSFRDWLKKQLYRTYHEKNYITLSREPERLYLFFIMSSSSPVSEKILGPEHEDDLCSLLKDGWLDRSPEYDGRGLTVVHDTISEEILLIRLQERQESLESEIEHIFDFAFRYGKVAVENCFILFERISDRFREFKPDRAKKSFSEIMFGLFCRLIDERPGECMFLQWSLVKTPLMDERDKLELLAAKQVFFDEVMKDRGFGLLMALKMKHFHKNRAGYGDETTADAAARIKELLGKWLSFNRDFLLFRSISARVIASFIILFGLKDDWDWGEDGEKCAVRSLVTRWLEKYPKTIEVSFILQSWLDAGGEIGLIREYVGPWLKQYPLAMETSFVIRAWLDAKGEIALIREYVGPWLKQYPLEMDTRFVMKSWLDAKGEIALIREYVGPWLKQYPLAIETSFVMKSWLDAGGEIALIREYVGPWLKQYPLAIETSFVMKSWLDAKGEIALIREYVGPWLKQYPLEMDTSFVIRAWLDTGENPAEVIPFIIPWLEKFSDTFDASFVFKAWLKKTRDTDYIRIYAHRWLLRFKDHPRADFVIKRFCSIKNIPADVLDAAVHWCRKYSFDSEGLYALSYLTRCHIGNETLAAPWLTDALRQWIDRKKLRENDIANIETVLYNITQNRDFNRSGEAVRLRIKWFLSPHSFPPPDREFSYQGYLQARNYFLEYSRLLSEGLIDISAHGAAVEKFLKWVSRWKPGIKKQLKPDLESLAAQFPIHAALWQIVE